MVFVCLVGCFFNGRDIIESLYVTIVERTQSEFHECNNHKKFKVERDCDSGTGTRSSKLVERYTGVKLQWGYRHAKLQQILLSCLPRKIHS